MERYVLITPARNEAAYLKRTVQSVVNQTITPAKWVIVSDGSRDATEAIATRAARDTNFIELVVRKEDATPAGVNRKVAAFNQAYNRISGDPFDFVGNLDADIDLSRDYYERLLERFAENPRLGVAGGVLLEGEEVRFAPRFGDSPFHVPGAIQLIRRSCFEAVGQFNDRRYVGEDTVVEVMARMRGWDVRAYPEVHATHLRATGSSRGGGIRYKFRDGLRDYANGSHPVYELAKCFRRAPHRPFLLGSLGMGCGYLWALLTSVERPPDEVVRFMQTEQLARLRTILRGADSRTGALE